MGKLTPMMQQYMEVKNQYKDCILFFRLGDFYEMFFEDAITASKELDITLTARDCGLKEKAPMCGVPYHSADSYIHRLIEKGYKVAMCEQVEDPRVAKGIVKREVVRIITPGTNMNPDGLEDKKNHYLSCIYQHENNFGFAIVDITTGEFQVTQWTDTDEHRKLIDELGKFEPQEVIFNSSLALDEKKLNEIQSRFQCFMNPYEDWHFEPTICDQKLCQHFQVHALDGLGLDELEYGISAAGALLQYLQETQKISLSHLSRIIPYFTHDYMVLDITTRRNLELVETLREKQRRGSLLWVLDQTKTAMGSRLLRKWIEQPLIHPEDIIKRLDGVEEFKEDPLLRSDLKDLLGGVYDLERLMSKVIYGTVNGRDLIALKNSLSLLPAIHALLEPAQAIYQQEIYKQLDILEDIHTLIHLSIHDEPPISIREGDIIKKGYNDEVDHLHRAKTEGKQWLAALEAEEREKTGIKNIRIRYNKIFGYFIEVTKSHLGAVPDRYIRKQTLANAERYITPELKEIEENILGAEEKVVELEYDLFIEIREKIAKEVKRIQKTAQWVATIDVLQSLAEVAERQDYHKPMITQDGTIQIKDGRHPVVEKMMPMEHFISNDTYLNQKEHQLCIITGPNMAGKSTYMRQVALIVLMAQMGSFVPAKEAHISVVDRIFTRVGASDDLSSGQSTFMVEMSEVSNILHNATKNSLLILDEIGRGTSTFDGLSIAWAVVEHIADSSKIGAKTLFATHYHELTELEGKIPSVQNYCIAVKEQGDDIIFLRKIQPGGADHSYGIEVAKLAGVPLEVIERARVILSELEAADIAKNPTTISLEKNPPTPPISISQMPATEEPSLQLDLFSQHKHELLEELKELNIIEMTPMETMQKLYELNQKAKQWMK